MGAAELEVVLAMARRDMDEARAGLGGDEIAPAAAACPES